MMGDMPSPPRSLRGPVAVAALTLLLAWPAHAQMASHPGAQTLDEAQHLFYSGRYESSAAIALALHQADPSNLAAFELRTSALHFQIKRAMGPLTDKDDREKAFKACGTCPGLLKVFLDDTEAGRTAARALVAKNEKDESALFYLGKINLNYVWLQLGTLGKRTGWNEYWEARKSLDAALKLNPQHARARLARAWIDYIVDTKVKFGLKWILGGGSKKEGLVTIRAMAMGEAKPYEKAEAQFALWEIELREKNVPAAVAAAKLVARDFPDNEELTRFLAANQAVAEPPAKK